MAITDNAFTGDELNAAMTANPELVNILVGTVKANENIRKTLEPDFIAPKTKEFAEGIEKDVLELTGIQKNAGEKYYDYQKRAFAEYNKGLKDEILLLKDKSNPSAADKQRIDQLEKMLVEKDKDFEGKLTAKQKEVAGIRIASAMDTALQQIRTSYKKDLPENILKLAENAAVNKLMAIAAVQDDNAVTFLNEKGEVMVSTSNYKPLTALEMLKAELNDVLEGENKKEGAGSDGKEKENGGETAGGKFNGVPASVTTQVQLAEHLAKLGIAHGSAEYDKIWLEHATKLKLR